MRQRIRFVENQVFHARAGLFLARLARQHHEHQPLEPVDVHFIAIERDETIGSVPGYADRFAREVGRSVADVLGLSARLES